jgi:hypothetical protein
MPYVAEQGRNSFQLCSTCPGVQCSALSFTNHGNSNAVKGTFTGTTAHLTGQKGRGQ